jgi:hypothetical protein
MGRASDRAAAKKHKKALKRAQKLRDRDRPSSPAARALGGIMRSAMPWVVSGRQDRPPWASSAAFTPAAAEMAAKAGMLMDGEPLHPQIVAKLREFVGWNGREWTVGKARAASTEELVTALEGVGVSVDAASFAREAANQTSGWAVAGGWNAPEADEQFLGVVACELWRRWCPETPSMEMIEDAIQEGYACFDRGDEDGAAVIWLDAWDDLLRRLPAEVATLAGASAACPGPQSVSNWIGDAMMAINNHAVGRVDRAERGLAWVRALRDRFIDEGMVVEQEATFLYMLGRHPEADDLLRLRIAEDPDDPMPYVVLSNELGRAVEPGSEPRDREAAIQLIEAALRRPVRDAADWDLEARLAELRLGGT